MLYEVTTTIPVRMRFVTDAANPETARHRLEVLRIDLHEHVSQWRPERLGAIHQDLAFEQHTIPVVVKRLEVAEPLAVTAVVA
jgi:hypothetical protein